MGQEMLRLPPSHGGPEAGELEQVIHSCTAGSLGALPWTTISQAKLLLAAFSLQGPKGLSDVAVKNISFMSLLKLPLRTHCLLYPGNMSHGKGSGHTIRIQILCGHLKT